MKISNISGKERSSILGLAQTPQTLALVRIGKAILHTFRVKRWPGPLIKFRQSLLKTQLHSRFVQFYTLGCEEILAT